MEAFGRPRTATKVQTRLHFDRSLAWRCPRNPLREFLLIGPHPTRLSFARGVLHVPHRKAPFRTSAGVWRIVQASPRIVIPCYPIGWLKSSEEEGPRRQVHCDLDFAPSGEDQTWTSSNAGPRPPARAHRRTSPARFASIRCPIHQSRGACPPPASRSSRERVPPGPCIRSVRR